jgi:hypothetical protein
MSQLVVVVLLVLIAQSGAHSWRWRVGRALTALSRRRARAALLLGAFAVGSCAAFCLVRPPVPRVHDEFSYLLAADTFASGRVTNPTHPMWTHLETIHVLQQPTYMSKYPPAQGLALALGQRLGGAIAGAWLAVGASIIAIYWMLLGWQPRRWALAGAAVMGTCIIIGRPEFGVDYAYWGRTYWGGAVAAAAGALLLGSWPRIVAGPRRPVLGAILGLALAVLAASRPMEGLILSVLVGAAMALELRARGLRACKPLALPAALVLLPAGLATAYYNVRITGDPLLMPYQAYERQYSITPFLLWMPLRPMPEYRHQSIRDYETIADPSWYTRQHRSPRAYVGAVVEKMKRLWAFYVGALLLVALLPLLRIAGRRPTKAALIVLALFFAAFLQLTYARPHYVAPVAGLIALVLSEGLRGLSTWLRSRSFGRDLAVAVLVVAVARVPVLIAATALAHRVKSLPLLDTGYHVERARILRWLEQVPGKHVVIVRYDVGHRPGEEWVYNRADIDAAHVVWAHAMSDAEDRALLQYFRDRRGWVLRADQWRGDPFLLPRPWPAPPPPWSSTSGAATHSPIGATPPD